MSDSHLLILPPLSSFHYNSPPNNSHRSIFHPPAMNHHHNEQSSLSVPSLLHLRIPTPSAQDITPKFFLNPSPSKSENSFDSFLSSLPSQKFSIHSSSVSSSSSSTSSPSSKKNEENHGSNSNPNNRSPLKSTYGPDFDRDNRKHVRVNNDQLNALIQAYESESMPTREANHELAKKLGMSYRRVQVWFQNRRAKDRRTKAGKEKGENALDDGSSLSDQSQEFNSAVSSLSQIGRGSGDDRSEILHEKTEEEASNERKSDSEESDTKYPPESRKARVDFLLS